MGSIFEVAKDAAAKAAYHKIFARYEKPDFTLSGALCDYSLVESRLPRKLVSVKSRSADLQGYYYKCQHSRKLVVVAHGLHACADEFLPQILFFYSHGYNVFSYDVTGCGSSGGDWMIGLPQFAVDLDYVLTYLTSWSETKNMSKYLFGHSMGGFAVLSNLKKHKNIKACAAVSAPDDAYHLAVIKGAQYTGLLGGSAGPIPIRIPVVTDLVVGANILTSKFVLDYQNELFGDYVGFTALSGINAVKCPIFLAHSPLDMTIEYIGLSAISKKKDFTNPNVTTYIPKFKQMGHSKILYSKDAIRYQNEIEDKVKDYKKEHDGCDVNALRNIYSTVDRYKYSELNDEMMCKILEVFDSADVKLLR